MKYKKIKSIKKIDKKVKIYSPNVQDNHNYFTNGNLLSKNCIMILDEAQNCDMRQLMLYITRKGENSKVLIIGDSAQSDVYQRRSALNDFSVMIENVERVGTFKFNREDIVRSKILIEITDLYETWKEENEKD